MGFDTAIKNKALHPPEFMIKSSSIRAFDS
jgi:hypothetical protein